MRVCDLIRHHCVARADVGLNTVPYYVEMHADLLGVPRSRFGESAVQSLFKSTVAQQCSAGGLAVISSDVSILQFNDLPSSDAGSTCTFLVSSARWK